MSTNIKKNLTDMFNQNKALLLTELLSYTKKYFPSDRDRANALIELLEPDVKTIPDAKKLLSILELHRQSLDPRSTLGISLQQFCSAINLSNPYLQLISQDLQKLKMFPKGSYNINMEAYQNFHALMKERLSDTPPVSCHPGLLTSETEALVYPEKFYSDHLPMYDQSNRLVTWNVLDSNGPNGYGVGKDTNYDFEKRARVQDALLKLIQSGKVDVITLQEVSEELANALELKCPDWDITFDVGQQQTWGQITIFNKNKYEKLAEGPADDQCHACFQSLLQNKKTNEILLVNNVHKMHTDLPDHTEQVIRDLSSVAETSGKKTSIHNAAVQEKLANIEKSVAFKSVTSGDFNSRCVNSQSNNVITGSVPPGFRKSLNSDGREFKRMGVDFTDGVFESHNNNIIHQVILEPINPQNWQSFPYSMLNVDTFDKVQQEELLGYRPIVCVDSIYSELLEKEAELREFSHTNNIYLRKAVNALNEKAYGVYVKSPSRLLEFLSKWDSSVFPAPTQVDLWGAVSSIVLKTEFPTFKQHIEKGISELNQYQIGNTPIYEFDTNTLFRSLLAERLLTGKIDVNVNPDTYEVAITFENTQSDSNPVLFKYLSEMCTNISGNTLIFSCNEMQKNYENIQQRIADFKEYASILSYIKTMDTVVCRDDLNSVVNYITRNLDKLSNIEHKHTSPLLKEVAQLSADLSRRLGTMSRVLTDETDYSQKIAILWPEVIQYKEKSNGAKDGDRCIFQVYLNALTKQSDNFTKLFEQAKIKIIEKDKYDTNPSPLAIIRESILILESRLNGMLVVNKAKLFQPATQDIATTEQILLTLYAVSHCIDYLSDNSENTTLDALIRLEKARDIVVKVTTEKLLSIKDFTKTDLINAYQEVIKMHSPKNSSTEADRAASLELLNSTEEGKLLLSELSNKLTEEETPGLISGLTK